MSSLARLLNTEGTDPTLRQKMNVSYGLILGAMFTAYPFFFVSLARRQEPMTAVLAFLIIVMTICVAWLRHTRRTNVVVWAFSFSVILVEPFLINNNLLSGGLAFSLFAGIPVFYLTGGIRLGTVWVLSSLAVMLGMLGLQLRGDLTLPMSPLLFIGYIIFITETAVFVYIYAREKEKLSQTLERQKAGVEHEVQVRTHQYQEERAKLAASIESLRTGFIILDHEMRLLSINEAGRHILSSSEPHPADGQPSQPAVRTFHDLLDRLQGDYDLIAAVKDCMRRGAAVSARDIPFGNRFLAIAITPIVDHGAVIGTVVLVEDITDRKALERSRDEFFSIASHELRTPLTAIMGNASMALRYYDKMSDTDRKDTLNEINISGKRLIAIVSDFLDTSRLEQGQVKFDLEPMDARALVQSLGRELKESLAAKHLTFKVAPAGQDPLMVVADHDRLKQILINLVDNAIKYTPKGSITLELTRDKHAARIAVIDTGSGIPVESQHLLFRKFQQASNNILTRDNTQSTGLGLYISKMMAEGMNGELILEQTKVGQGSTFVVELPLAPAATSRT